MGSTQFFKVLKFRHIAQQISKNFHTKLKTQPEKCKRKAGRVKKIVMNNSTVFRCRSSRLLPEAASVSFRNYCSCNNKFGLLSRHNYHEEVEAAINNQILAEFNAGFAYLSMACYFARNDVAMYGAHKYFMKMYREEIEHALAFIDHQNLRGGHVKLCSITTVECSDWCSIHKALEVSLEMEKLVLDKLEDLLKLSEQHNDGYTHEILSSVFIKEGLLSVKQLAGLLTRANRLGTCGMSEYFLDRELSKIAAYGPT